MTDTPQRSAELPIIEHQGLSVLLDRLPFRIGRASANDLTLNQDRLISRVHCRIERSNQGYRLTNLASHNGILVNGGASEQVLLADGDRIRIGRQVLIFRQPAPPTPAVRRRRPDRLRRSHPGPVLLLLAAVLLVLVTSLMLLAHSRSASVPVTARKPSAGDELATLRTELATLRVSLRTRRAPDSERTKRHGSATQVQRAATEVQRVAMEVQRAATESQRSATEAQRSATRVRRPAPRRQRSATELPPIPPKTRPRPRAEPVRRLKRQGTSISRVKRSTPSGRSQATLRKIPFYGLRIGGPRIAFVVDRSSSMADQWSEVQAKLCSAIRALTPKHRFTVVFFAAAPTLLSRKLLPGTPEVKREVIRYIRSQRARGATDPRQALRLVLKDPRALDEVVLLTDGRLKERDHAYIEAYQAFAGRRRKMNKPIAQLRLVAMRDHSLMGRSLLPRRRLTTAGR